MKSSTRPDIKNYLDIHDYLKSVYNFLKSQSSDFSYEKWSVELGINNKSFLRRIIIGDRSLTESTSQAFCDYLQLQKSDREYFYLLVLYSKARSSEEKDLYGRRLRHLIRAEYPQQELPTPSSFILRPLYPRLLAVLGFKDIEKTPQDLAALLRTSLPEVQQALRILMDLGLAEPEGDLESSPWQGKTTAFKVPADLGNNALLNYHELCLQDAIKAQTLAKNERRYHSAIVPLNEDTFEEFMCDLQIFVKQTLSKFDSQDLANHRLFQINFNLHSVSEKAPFDVKGLSGNT